MIRATKEGNAFNNFLNIAGTITGGGDMTPHPIRPLQTGPGTYEADFDASEQGSYLCYLNYTGQDGKSGSLLAGTTVNSSPEMRNLQSNNALLKQIAERTGGRFLTPFDVASADLFSRDGLTVTDSPQSIWDLLVPWLLALIIIDVAIRRIAWDWPATKKMALAVADYVRTFTMTYRKVESPDMLSNLKRVREEVAEQKFKSESDTVRVPAAATVGPGPIPGRNLKPATAWTANLLRSSAGLSTNPFHPRRSALSPRGLWDSANIPADCLRPSGAHSRRLNNNRKSDFNFKEVFRWQYPPPFPALIPRSRPRANNFVRTIAPFRLRSAR